MSGITAVVAGLLLVGGFAYSLYAIHRAPEGSALRRYGASEYSVVSLVALLCVGVALIVRGIF